MMNLLYTEFIVQMLWTITEIILQTKLPELNITDIKNKNLSEETHRIFWLQK